MLDSFYLENTLKDAVLSAFFDNCTDHSLVGDHVGNVGNDVICGAVVGGG